MDIIEKDLPQLIVGLDSCDDSANYIHIEDVKENTNYYCPCCRGLIKPRAYKKEINYQMQSHFYHETGGCNEETYIHYICKTWLFEKGCKFIVSNVKYEVENIEIEKTLHTSFGDYIPDIIVTTTIGKILFFEIKTTNRKTQLYIPKWDELGNDVVEVDTRYFINQKYKNDIPKFNPIYSDGECFIKNYSRTDYEDTIAKRKLEWKRQDKLNYKIQWERLDRFWIAIQSYIKENLSEEKVLAYFNKLDYSDKIWVYYSTKKKSCIKLKDLLKENINQHFFNMIDSLQDDRINVSLKHVSPKIYEVHYRTEFSYLNYTLFEEEVTKVKIQKGDLLSLDYEDDIKDGFSRMKTFISQGENILKRVRYISTLPFVKSITPYSHWATENYRLCNLYFSIEFMENIHNKYIKEIIGTERYVLSTQLSESYVQKLYEKYKNKTLVDLEDEFIKSALKKNHLYHEILCNLQKICNNTSYLQLKVSDDYRIITLLNSCTRIFEYEYTKQDLFGVFEENIKKIFMSYIEYQIKQYAKISTYVDLINSCRNKLWKATNFDGNSITLYLCDPKTCKEIKFKYISLCNSNDIKRDILNGMNALLEYAENYYGIRFMEDK